MKVVKSHSHLSYKQTSLLKGIAITCIVLHNFYRNVPPHFGENEFWINKSYLTDWLQYIQNTPLNFLIAFFSFLGHYGVSAFILISGYGLTLSYKNKEVSYFSFLKKRILKIYPTFLLAVLTWVLCVLFTTDNINYTELIKEVFYKLTFFSVFSEKYFFALRGPWWFFGLIVQLYIAFPLIISTLKNKKKYIFILLLLSCITYRFVVGGGLLFYGNLAYALPTFMIGCYIGFKESIKLPKFTGLISLILLLWAQGNSNIWSFGPIFAGLAFLSLTIYLNEQHYTLKWLTKIGEISFHLFVFHSVIRPIFIKWAIDLNSDIYTNMIGYLFFFCSVMTSYLFLALDNKIRILSKLKA